MRVFVFLFEHRCKDSAIWLALQIEGVFCLLCVKLYLPLQAANGRAVVCADGADCKLCDCFSNAARSRVNLFTLRTEKAPESPFWGLKKEGKDEKEDSTPWFPVNGR